LPNTIPLKKGLIFRPSGGMLIGGKKQTWLTFGRSMSTFVLEIKSILVLYPTDERQL
jgi:hypothetical protein